MWAVPVWWLAVFPVWKTWNKKFCANILSWSDPTLCSHKHSRKLGSYAGQTNSTPAIDAGHQTPRRVGGPWMRILRGMMHSIGTLLTILDSYKSSPGSKVLSFGRHIRFSPAARLIVIQSIIIWREFWFMIHRYWSCQTRAGQLSSRCIRHSLQEALPKRRPQRIMGTRYFRNMTVVDSCRTTAACCQ
jgi:hypothetical protein